MGVRRSDVIVIGVDIGYNSFKQEWYEEEEDYYDKYRLNRKSEKGSIVYVADGMSGNYFVVGELIVNDYDGDYGLGLFIHDEKSKEFKAAKKRVKQHLIDTFGIDSDPKYITLTHWS